MRLLEHCAGSPSRWLCMLSTEVVYSHWLWIHLRLRWTFSVRVHLLFKNATEKVPNQRSVREGCDRPCGSRLITSVSIAWLWLLFLNPESHSHTAPFSLLCVSAGEACLLFGRNEGGIQSAEKKKKILSWHSKLRSLMGVILFLWFPAILWSPLQPYEAQRQLAEMSGTKRVGVYKKENRERCGTAELYCRSRNRYSLLSECTARWPDGVCREIDWAHWMQLHCYFTVRVLHPWVLRHLPLSQGDDSITPWFFGVGLCAHQLM